MRGQCLNKQPAGLQYFVSFTSHSIRLKRKVFPMFIENNERKMFHLEVCLISFRLPAYPSLCPLDPNLMVHICADGVRVGVGVGVCVCVWVLENKLNRFHSAARWYANADCGRLRDGEAGNESLHRLVRTTMTDAAFPSIIYIGGRHAKIYAHLSSSALGGRKTWRLLHVINGASRFFIENNIH